MPETTTHKFLIVSDDDVARNTLAKYIRDMGYAKVLTSGQATEAWSMIRHLKVDIVVSNWHLPEMSGLALLKIIRADNNYARLPFLLIADSIDKTQVLAAGEAGVTDIITVPFSKETFQTKIGQALVADEDERSREFKKWYDKGLDLMRQGRYEEALKVFKHSLTIHESAEIHYNMGFIHTAQGRYDQALLAFRRATMIDNAHALSYQRMAEVYTLLGRAVDAESCYNKAAEIYLERQMDADAESMLMQALENNPETINVYNTLGILYRRQGRYPEAIKAYRRALKVTPEDEHIHYNLARVYLSENSHRRAREALRAALNIRPDFEEAVELLTSMETGMNLEKFTEKEK